jgi:hypothetical protein
MVLEGIVKDLWENTEKITQPNYAFDSNKTKFDKATKSIHEQYKGGSVEGVELIDRISEFSQIYLESAGINYDSLEIGSNNARYYLEMKRMLGQNFEVFKQSLKQGDMSTALYVVQNAVSNQNIAAEQNWIIDNLNESPMDDRIKWAKEAAKRIGVDDHIKILGDLPGYFASLQQIKTISERYK